MNKGFPTQLFIIAGEVSGDIHGSRLMKAINSVRPDLGFSGIGGDLMIRCGLHMLYHMRQMAFLGIGEVIRHLPFILSVLKHVRSYLRKENVDAVILIDYPGFNLKVARYAHQLQIPVVYYISPQLWAWGQKRVKKIRKYVSKMIVIFPFEVDFYSSHRITATYVGHPLVDAFGENIRVKEKRDGQNVLGLLPGSRLHELENLLPDMIRTARILFQKKMIHRAVIARVDHISDEIYHQYLDHAEFIEIQKNSGQEFYEQLDAALVSSGTATLETGYFRVPMVVVYRVGRITWTLGRLLVKLKMIGLVNIVAGEKICPELLQDDFTPDKAAGLLEGVLEAKENQNMRERLKVIRENLGSAGASDRAAREIISFLEESAVGGV